ncbi:protein of unknown function DUF81 [Thalassoporum mexicanum PCC 7367]|uniref:sulfite exporter TauE/SafE family protein n=1 Tax=Thalassoporum mexicanum TaxID=3457544 RepID=UPI00029FAD4A|nr:sulfite exporter TauE/SafE family protein [Pseudanabaena sp. PCC 7367]AFY71167.1 protein of unknown function DUF81 [Pseudanabaena sp. PCC 7367]
MLDLTYAYMFPVAIAISTVAMASGVEGGTFFAPIFLLAIGLPPDIAIGAALITETFGFTSGLVAYARQGAIDYRLGGSLLLFTIPAAIFGSWLVQWINPIALSVIFGLVLLAIAVSLIVSSQADANEGDSSVVNSFGVNSLTTNQSEALLEDSLTQDESTAPSSRANYLGGAIAVAGGALLGMIATGLGELNGFYLLKIKRVPGTTAVATNVFVVAITAMTASIGQFSYFLHQGGTALETLVSVVTFTVPGVIIGGQIGAFVAKQISQHALEKFLAVVFALVAAILLRNALPSVTDSLVSML